MDYDLVAGLRDGHPAWRLVRAANSPLVLSFLGRYFVDENHGATPAGDLISALDDELYVLNATDPNNPRYPRAPEEYLEDWAAGESGWLRRFYPVGSDEVHYDATSAFEKAYAWVVSLQERAFVGTESRLQTIVELLQQIVRGAQADPEIRLAELQRQRDDIDRQIAQVAAGDVPVLSDTALRERYHLLTSSARELLSDFREVEEKFRALDREARERIAGWDGAKGELLADLVGSRSDINSSDQGRSFRAFYDLLLSSARQEELSELLAQVQSIPSIDADSRLPTIHHDWADAAERTQRTVRQISEQLRRFLDDQVWLENRRVLDLVREIEVAALSVRNDPPHVGLEMDEPGVRVALPLDRPLYDPAPQSRVDSLLDPTVEAAVDTSALFRQAYVDQARLVNNVRSAVPRNSTALLSDIVALHPIELGAAEIIGYLSITDDDVEVELDETGETLLDFLEQGVRRRVRMPLVKVSRS